MFARKLFLMAGMALLLVFSALPTGAFAQAGGTVVASGLLSPGPIAIGPDGSIYVAEGGSGGAETISAPDGSSATRGYSAQITKIAPDGSKTVVARNLPSLAGQEGTNGASEMIWGAGALWAVWYATPEGVTALPGEGSLVRIDPSTGITTTVANMSAYEVAHNPDGLSPESNPYGLTAGSDGNVYVTDAAGNDVLKVNPANGEVSLVAVIPGLPLPAEMQAPGGNPGRNGAQELDPVPTGVQMGADGALYVSLLSGAPFPVGAAKVVKVTSGGQVSDAATGFSMLTDIEAGPNGSWYVNSFAEFDPTSQTGFKPDSGKVIRINADGSKSTVVSGLNFVSKIAVDGSGNVYAAMVTGDVMRWSGAPVGMPSTGAALPLGNLIFGGLVVLAFGVALRLFARRSESSVSL